MSVTHLTKENFDEIVGPSDLVVIDFTADWCEPCQAFSENFEALADAFKGAVFAQVNVGEEPELADDFAVRSVPTIMILRHNVAVYMQSGALTTGELTSLLQDAQALSMEEIKSQLQKS